MLSVTCLILIIINTLSVEYSHGATDLYIIKVHQIKCIDIDPDHVKNVTCNVKAVRHKQGIINLYFIQIVDQQSVQISAFIQNSAGHFLPTFAKFEYDYCEWNKLLNAGGPLMRIIDRMHDFGSDKVKVCPFTAPFELMNFELNEFASKNMPPIMPAGEYKLIVRSYNKPTNRTYITVVIRLAIKAKGVKGSMADLSMLNMG